MCHRHIFNYGAYVYFLADYCMGHVHTFCTIVTTPRTIDPTGSPWARQFRMVDNFYFAYIRTKSTACGCQQSLSSVCGGQCHWALLPLLLLPFAAAIAARPLFVGIDVMRVQA